MSTLSKIDKIQWGKILIKDKQYHDVLIYNNTIEERNYSKLKQIFGTGHKIGDWELQKLLSNNPEIIIFGTGWLSAIKVPKNTQDKIKQKGIRLKLLKSSKAVKEYNRLIQEGKKVNALIHSTC